MLNKRHNFPKDTLLFCLGLVIFTGLNIFSAFTMELHFDEAYYWLYSKYPAFGYFDHPPMIAWLIMAGRFMLGGEIGVRILIIVLSTFSMVVLWRMAKRYSSNALLFWALIFSVGLIHPYCFIATPDAPLLFFSILFFYFFSRYLEKNNFQNAVLLAFTIAMMIYSKYHAFLLLGLVILSNLKLLKRISFWIIVLLTIVYLLPHIFWQIENNFPTFRFQFIDGHKGDYHFAVTLKYIFSELVITGPLLGWLFLYAMAKVKSQNYWEKALKYSGIGIFLFFLIATIKGSFEAHWTLIAMPPLLLLSFMYIIQNPKWGKWVYIAGATNFIILLALRIMIITPIAEKIKPLQKFTGNLIENQIIKNFTGNNPVIFQDEWKDASMFAFYTQNQNVEALNSGLYRKNQYDILDRDEFLNGETVTVITTDSMQFSDCSKIITNKSVFYGKIIPNFKSYYHIYFDLKELTVVNNLLKASVTIHNPGEDTLRLGEAYNLKSSFQLYSNNSRKWIVLAEYPVDNIIILPNGSYNLEPKLNIDSEMLDKKNVLLTLKIGELKPVPSSYQVDLKKGQFK